MRLVRGNVLFVVENKDSLGGTERGLPQKFPRPVFDTVGDWVCVFPSGLPEQSRLGAVRSQLAETGWSICVAGGEWTQPQLR